MSNYKLTFFEGRGRAELTRLTFTLAGAEFEDVRVPFDQWRNVMATKQFNEVPILEVDGVTLCQSNAIATFVAKRLDVAGKNDLEEAQSLMVVLTLEDIVIPIIDYYHHQRSDLYPQLDKSKLPELKQKLEEEILPSVLGKLEAMLKSNNGGDGYFVGDNATYADLAWAHNITWTDTVKIDAKLDNFPKLKALKSRVESIPSIAAWQAKWKHLPF